MNGRAEAAAAYGEPPMNFLFPRNASSTIRCSVAALVGGSVAGVFVNRAMPPREAADEPSWVNLDAPRGAGARQLRELRPYTG